MTILVNDASPVIMTESDDYLVAVINATPLITPDGQGYALTVADNAPVILQDSDAYTLIASSTSLVTLAAGSQGPRGIQGVKGDTGEQGPQGIRGLTGPTGGTAIELIAGIDLGGNRVVTGEAGYADSSDLATISRAVGITVGAATAGSPVNIVASGELDGFFGLTVNTPVFLSTNGTLTHTAPVAGYIQRIGVAVSSTKILINIQEPLAL